MNNNITNNNRIQSQLSPDELAASLGFMTGLGEQLMPKDQLEATEQPQEAPQAPESEETLDLGEDTTKQENEAKITEIETLLDEKLEAMKNELLEAINKKDKKE